MNEQHLNTIRELEGRIEKMAHQVGNLQRELRIVTARYERQLEETGDEHAKALIAALDEIEGLTIDRDRLTNDLERHTAESAKLEPRPELEIEKELAEYEGENKRLIAFIQTVADSRTKFASDARQLLGQ